MGYVNDYMVMLHVHYDIYIYRGWTSYYIQVAYSMIINVVKYLFQQKEHLHTLELFSFSAGSI